MNKEISFKILFLHHSTGQIIYSGWKPDTKIFQKLYSRKPYVERWFENYNRQNKTNYLIEQQFFPKREPYGWNNYPYDYYNIWVKHTGEQPFKNEPTLEILTKQYNLIIFKHCFPVCTIIEDTGHPDIESPKKRIENYKLQYLALKEKMNEFPNTKFLIWTGAAQVENNIKEEDAQRAKDFFDWIKTEWNSQNKNIFIWDFYGLETEGQLYLKPEFAISPSNSHPNKEFAKKASIQFCKRIIEVIETNRICNLLV